MAHSDSSDANLASQLSRTLDANSVAAIVVAAGRGERFGAAENKVLLALCGRAIWLRSIDALRKCEAIGTIVLVVRACDRESIDTIVRGEGLPIMIATGGAERCDSVRAGLQTLLELEAPPAWVAVHDAARPLVSTIDIAAVIAAAYQSQAAILATRVRGTIKRAAGEWAINQTVDRRELWEAQTPQVFATAVLADAFARHRGRPVTDDAELVERSGVTVRLVPGSAENLKITQTEDLPIATAIFNHRINTP